MDKNGSKMTENGSKWAENGSNLANLAENSPIIAQILREIAGNLIAGIAKLMGVRIGFCDVFFP
jgi:hypothetical protein